MTHHQLQRIASDLTLPHILHAPFPSFQVPFVPTREAHTAETSSRPDVVPRERGTVA